MNSKQEQYFCVPSVFITANSVNKFIDNIYTWVVISVISVPRTAKIFDTITVI